MQWYALKTWAGREDELADLVNETLPEGSGCESFVLRHERIWRRERQNILHVEPLFPGYVFVTCPADWTDVVHSQLDELADALAEEMAFSSYPLSDAETALMEQIQDADHVVSLSYVSTDGAGHLYTIDGPLAVCRDRVLKWGFKKRFAIIRLDFLGMEQTAALGIYLNEDIGTGVLSRRMPGYHGPERASAAG